MFKDEQLEKVLESGIEDYAADFLADVDAPLRHKWRVEQTIEAARNAPCGLAEGLGLLLLDVCGLGGERGTGWNGRTERYRLFSKLGKGRWQASDGDAYRVAAMDALESHRVRVLPELEGDNVSEFGIQVVRVNRLDFEDSDYILFGIEEDVDQRIHSLCRRVLWQHAYLSQLVQTRPPWMDGPGAEVADLTMGETADWASLLNHSANVLHLWDRRRLRLGNNEAIMEPLRNTGWFRDISIRDELDGEQSPKIVAHPGAGWPTSNPPAYLTLPVY